MLDVGLATGDVLLEKVGELTSEELAARVARLRLNDKKQDLRMLGLSKAIKTYMHGGNFDAAQFFVSLFEAPKPISDADAEKYFAAIARKPKNRKRR